MTAATAVLIALGLAAFQEDGLVWHAESVEGRTLTSQGAEAAVNPASVTKIATALWALEEFGPGHRWSTGVSWSGEPRADGTVDGDLHVLGGHDPDFQLENAWSIGRRLNELGLRSVAGDLVLDEAFWIGWEHGAEGRQADPAARLHEMGERLRRALDPGRWGPEERRAWKDWSERRPDLPGIPPAVAVRGRVRERSAPAPEPRLLHRSKPLEAVLKRFLAYSNNDIERVVAPLGGAAGLEAFSLATLGLEPGELRFATASGLGANRMSPRAVVLLLRAFAARLDAVGLRPEDLLPMPGCDPGSLEGAMPGWQTGERVGALAAKTGTLIREDRGVAAMAGYLYGREGTALLMVAVPRSGHRIVGARRDIELWTDHLLADLGGAAPRPCGAPVQSSEDGAEIAMTQATGTGGG